MMSGQVKEAAGVLGTGVDHVGVRGLGLPSGEEAEGTGRQTYAQALTIEGFRHSRQKT